MFDFTALENLSSPVVIAHRGAVSYAHENTLEAFEAAVSVGADAVEFDIRRASDGALVICHDAVVPGKRRLVSRVPCDYLQTAARKRGFHVPTLEQTLHHLCGRMALDIELKEPGYEAEVLALVEEYFDLRNVVFTSFVESTVKRLKVLSPAATVGLLIGAHRLRSMLSSKRVLSIARIRRVNADFVAPHRFLVRLPFLRRMRAAGIPLLVWTVNDLRSARRLARLGVSGIITDVPEKMVGKLGPATVHSGGR